MTTAHEFTTVEAELLRSIPAGAQLTRAAFAGQPFRLEVRGQAVTHWPEAVVLALIERGLMFAAQQAAAWKDAPARPFTVGLTPDGVKARKRVLDGRADLREAA